MSKVNVKVVKNFINQDEIDVLNDWSIMNFENNRHQYNDPHMDNYHDETRFTTRLGNTEDYLKKEYNINYPSLALDIKDRIIDLFRMDGVRTPPSYFNGIVNGIGFENGSICNHIDPIYYEGTETMHCNIITQKSESGGITIIEGVQYDIEEGDLLCYIVSRQYHEVTKTLGKTKRILWVFGFCLEQEKINQIFGE
jgi:hypothetical protein